MKQQIFCDLCGKEIRKLHPTDEPYPQEHIKFLKGFSLDDYICDYCGKFIREDDVAWAFSTWADYGGVPYYEWEKDFIKLDIENDT